MNGIFLICFLLILVISLRVDMQVLKNARKGMKFAYVLFMLLTLGLLSAKYLHINIPMPTRFFIHAVSPWVRNLVGI